MKKFISIILAMVICASFVITAPEANAADTDSVKEIVYNLVADKKGGQLWYCTESKVSQYFSSQNWTFFDMAEIFEQIAADYANLEVEGAVFGSDLSEKAIAYAFTRMLNFSPNNYFRVTTVNTTYDYDISAHNPWFAIKLNNPGEVGRYSVDLGRNDIDTTQRISIWIAPYVEGKDNGEYYMTDENLVAKNQVFNKSVNSNDVTYDIDVKDSKTPYICVMMFSEEAKDFRFNSVILRKQAKFDFRADSNLSQTNTALKEIGENYNPKSKWYYFDMDEALKPGSGDKPSARILIDKMQIAAKAKNQWIALVLKGIDKGIYTANFEWMGRNTNASKDLSIYYAKIESGKTAEDYMINDNLIETSVNAYSEIDETILLDELDKKIVSDGKSDYIVIIKTNDEDIKSFELRKLLLNPIKISSVNFNIPDVKLVKGEETAGIVFVNGTINATEFSDLSSSNENVVTISDDGKIKAIGAGVATVTATFGGVSSSKIINVTAEPYALKYNFNISNFEYNKMPRKNVNDSSWNGVRVSNASIIGEDDLSSGLVNVLVVNKSLLDWKKQLSVETDKKDLGTKPCAPYYVLDSTFANGSSAKTEPWAFEYASSTVVNTRSNNLGLWSQVNVNKFVDTSIVTDHGSDELIYKDISPVLAIRLYVPNPGTYDVLMLHNLVGNTLRSGINVDVYFGKAPENKVTASSFDTVFSSLDKIGEYSSFESTGQSSIINDTAVKINEAGEYLLVFNMTEQNYQNNACRIVSNNKNYEYNNKRYLQYLIFDNITFEPSKENDVEGNVSRKGSFVVGSNISNASVIVSGTDYNGGVDSVDRGSSLVVEAPAVDGYKFCYWVRGSADNGKWVSGDSKYSFKLLTNTMLTAIYEEITETEDKQIEFWNQNGAYIATKVLTDEMELPIATLTGYTFDNWYVAETEKLDLTKLSSSITRAVAKYNAKSVNGVKFNGEIESDVVYNKEITKQIPNAKVWYRDGKPVAYGDTYTYYVWDATNITYSTEVPADKTPLVVLEEGNGGWMIEYDAGDKNIVEAGIVFGDNATVASCLAKATSQKNLSHGQFTASSDYENARGYIIYFDGDTYKVKYSD